MAANCFSRWSFWALFSLLIAATCFANTGDSTVELKKIDALLEGVKSSDVTFIRNGSEYTAQEAYTHLQRKLKSAQNSWFAPPKEEWTARLFIEKIASRSSLSKKPYLVRFKGGKVIEARVWLTEMLTAIETAK